MLRRIIYNKITGDILEIEVAEDLIPNEHIGMILQDRTIDNEKFEGKYDIKINTKTNKIEFKKVKVKTKEEKIQELENELLISKEKEIGGIM